MRRDGFLHVDSARSLGVGGLDSPARARIDRRPTTAALALLLPLHWAARVRSRWLPVVEETATFSRFTLVVLTHERTYHPSVLIHLRVRT